MNKQAPPPWLTVPDAAALVGRSVSTLRRLLPTIEERAPDAIRREASEGKGGGKIYLSSAWLIEHFGQAPPRIAAQDSAQDAAGLDAAGLVAVLEKQLDAKDKQISALQRDGEAKSRQIEDAQRLAGELSERVGQLAAVNAGLQNRIMQLSERAGPGAAPGGVPAAQDSAQGGGVDWLQVVVSAGIALCAGLVLWLIFA